MQIQAKQTTAAGGAKKAGAAPVREGATHRTLNQLRDELRGLSGDELQATSALEYRGFGAQKEYVGFVLITDDSAQPRCPHDPLPMNNKAFKTMVNALLEHYGAKAGKRELDFAGGVSPPGYSQVTLSDSGLGLYFENATGKPMGKLTGSL